MINCEPLPISENTFKEIALKIITDLVDYYEMTIQYKHHPDQFTFTEWKSILKDIRDGFLISISREKKTQKDEKIIERALFLFCRYFLDLIEKR
jgi:hypothetical protein